MRNCIFLIFCITLFTSCIKGEECDLVVHNAKIYSLNDRNEIFQAMAIKDGRIIEIGAERQILNKYRYQQSFDARTD